MPITTVSPSRTGRLVMMPSKGAVGGLSAARRDAGQVGAILRDVLLGGILLRLGLRDLGLRLRQSGLSRLPGSLLGVVVRLGDERVFVQTLGAVPVQPGVLGVGLGAVQVGREVRKAASAATKSVSAPCSDARVAFTSAAGCTFSSCASNCPFFTWSPSLT